LNFSKSYSYIAYWLQPEPAEAEGTSVAAPAEAEPPQAADAAGEDDLRKDVDTTDFVLAQPQPQPPAEEAAAAETTTTSTTSTTTTTTTATTRPTTTSVATTTLPPVLEEVYECY
jgi:hypothetical protein